MRIAVVSDIHANWTALQAVLADLRITAPDLVINGGDLVGSGSRPAEVVDKIIDLEWPSVVGNTDEMLWNRERLELQLNTLASRDPNRADSWRAILTDSLKDSLEIIGPARIAALKELPLEWKGDDLAVVHATPGDCWTSPQLDAADEEMVRAYSPLDRPLVVYGHIHQPFIRQAGPLTIANSGSVSLSYDGDPRSSYVLIADGQPQIRRVEYDVEAEIREMKARDCPHVDWLAAMLRTARYVMPT